jgi:hypothetical protein
VTYEFSTLPSLWIHGMRTLNEYTQLITPQASYFIHAILHQKVKFNKFYSSQISRREPLQLLGAHYYLSVHELSDNIPLLITPREVTWLATMTGQWYVYELPHPNVGNYSPTEVVEAPTASQVVDKITSPDFDFRRSVVLPTPIGEALIPAQDMRMSRIAVAFTSRAEAMAPR